MKVRTSQIPENSGKPQYPNRKTVSSKPEDFDDEIDDIDEDEDEDVKGAKHIKTIINFSDIGLSMSLFGIESIEKDIQFVEKPKAHWEYGIVLNKGVEQSTRFPKVDVAVWFIKEDVRDMRYDSMLEQLKKAGFDVIEV